MTTNDARRNERGSALLLALTVACLLSALGLAVVTTGTVEREMAANQVSGLAARYAADALARRVVSDLGGEADWTGLPGGTVRSAFVDVSLQPQTPWRQPLDLGQTTAALQQQTNAALPFGANTPRWRLFAFGSFRRLVGPDDGPGPYVVAWVADDPSEQDDDAAVDTNRCLLVHVAAFGMKGVRRDLELTVEQRPGETPPVRRLTWRDSF